MTELDYEKGDQYSWLCVEDLKPRPPEYEEVERLLNAEEFLYDYTSSLFVHPVSCSKNIKKPFYFSEKETCYL